MDNMHTDTNSILFAMTALEDLIGKVLLIQQPEVEESIVGATLLLTNHTDLFMFVGGGEAFLGVVIDVVLFEDFLLLEFEFLGDF